jgi:hypothetical protein
VGLFSRQFGKPTIEDFGDQLVRALRKADGTNEQSAAAVQIIRCSLTKQRTAREG